MKRAFILCAAMLLIISLLGSCTPKTSVPEAEAQSEELPAYTAGYIDGYLTVNVNDMEAAELVIPCPENGIFPDSCTDQHACIYNDGFCNLPKIITADDYENHILTLVDASGLGSGITSKFRIDFFFAKIDLSDPQLSTEKKEDILSKYPIAEFVPIYVFNPDAGNDTVEEMSLYLDMMGYDINSCLADLENIRRVAEDNGVSLDITHPSELAEPNHFTKITFEQGITQINHLCPYEFRYVESIHIPSSMEFLSNAAFKSMDNLTEITYDGTLAEWIEMNTKPVMGEEFFYELNVTSDVTVKCSDGEHHVTATEEQISPWLRDEQEICF
ncbi:MAG: hypothetical protein IKT46_01305 [Clostridia bacterium]|nr:hypothetical protein [Clostridia bacterium]